MEKSESNIAALTNSLEGAITGIPAPVRKNFLKAIGQLCTAAIDVPIAWFESKSGEIRATTEARNKIIKRQGDKIANKGEVPQEYINLAAAKYASKIIKEQINLDQIALTAAKELTGNSQDVAPESKEVDDISDDWLNEFENRAKVKSSEDMKIIFGKILSKEISKPGSFSIRTVQLISQLDNQAAKLFQIFCSQAVSIELNGVLKDARVVSLKGTAALNSLKDFGLKFDNLNILQEYGLIIPDYNCYMPYAPCIVHKEGYRPVPLRFGSRKYILVPINQQYDKELKLSGVALTKAGRELFPIIPTIDNVKYFEEFKAYLLTKQLQLEEVKENN